MNTRFSMIELAILRKLQALDRTIFARRGINFFDLSQAMKDLDIFPLPMITSRWGLYYLVRAGLVEKFRDEDHVWHYKITAEGLKQVRSIWSCLSDFELEILRQLRPHVFTSLHTRWVTGKQLIPVPAWFGGGLRTTLALYRLTATGFIDRQQKKGRPPEYMIATFAVCLLDRSVS